MKKIILLLIMLCSFTVKSQTITCQEAYKTIITYGYKENYVLCINSSMLTKAEYYVLEEIGYVVAYIKSSGYEINGRPYLFCGISRQRWNTFKNSGMFNSWGESFHKHIMDYTCNCR